MLNIKNIMKDKLKKKQNIFKVLVLGQKLSIFLYSDNVLVCNNILLFINIHMLKSVSFTTTIYF